MARAVVQRVSSATVEVNGACVGKIQAGVLILLGIGKSDEVPTVRKLAAKIAGLRIFEDGEGKMNLALADVKGSALVVSQFTLYADVRRGRRPSFVDAAGPERGERLYELFMDALREAGHYVEHGTFGAHMVVAMQNDGPVTIILDTDDL